MNRPIGRTLRFVFVAALVSSDALTASAAATPGPPASFGRARQNLAAGLLAPALADLRIATGESPEFAAAWVERGRVETRLGLFPEAKASLDRALAIDSASPAAAAAAARFRLLLLDLDGASRLLDPHLAAPRPAPEALAAAGQVAVARRRDAEAIALFERALAADPASADAWAGIAAARALREEHDEVIRACEKALASDPRHADAHVAHGYALFRKGDPLGATERFLEALRIDPWHLLAHTYLGNGILAVPEDFPPRDRDRAREKVRAGADACRRGDLAAALESFEAALALDPLDGLAHNGFAVALERLADRFAEAEGLFRPIEDSGREADPLGIEPFLLRAESLSPAERATLRRSVRPFARACQRLAALGATHDIVPLDQEITEPEYGRSFRGRRTFDLRSYDGLRGQGGFNAGTGVEKISSAAALRFNMFAHEFAHQVHLFAMSPAERDELASLFDAATREGRHLDFYSASNVEEYFAVGAEAYVSARKRPGLSVTAGHTRGELLDKDPDLFMFIRRFERGGAPSAPPSPFERGDSLLARNRFDEAARAYAETPRGSPSRRLALVRSAEAWALAGHAEAAEAMLVEASFRAPQNDVQAVRAELRLRREKSVEGALEALRDLSDFGRRRADLCEALLRTGRLPEAERRARDLAANEPASVRALVVLGRVAALRGDLAAAESAFRDALAPSRAQAAVHGELALVLAAMGRFAEAEEERRLALLAEPTNAAVLTLAGEASRLRGDVAAALGQFEAALALDPLDGRARLGRARALLDRGDERAAVAERDAAIERLLAPPPPGLAGLDAIAATAAFGDRVAGLAFRAIMRFDRGERARAEADCRAAIALSPSAREVLAATLRREGLEPEAARLPAPAAE